MVSLISLWCPFNNCFFFQHWKGNWWPLRWNKLKFPWANTSVRASSLASQPLAVALMKACGPRKLESVPPLITVIRKLSSLPAHQSLSSVVGSREKERLIRQQQEREVDCAGSWRLIGKLFRSHLMMPINTASILAIKRKWKVGTSGHSKETIARSDPLFFSFQPAGWWPRSFSF